MLVLATAFLCSSNWHTRLLALIYYMTKRINNVVSWRFFLFLRQIGSRYLILEVYKFLFCQFCNYSCQVFHWSTKNPNRVKINQRWLYIRLLIKPEMKFGFQRGANSVFIIDRFSQNFACGSEMWSTRRLLFPGLPHWIYPNSIKHSSACCWSEPLEMWHRPDFFLSANQECERTEWKYLPRVNGRWWR